MADLAEKEPDNVHIFNRTFVQQLFDRFSGQTLEAESPISFPHLQTYLMTHVVPEDVKERVKSFGKRPKNTLCGEIMISIIKSVSGNFEGRATGLIVCALEQCVWSHRNDYDVRSSFVEVLKKLSKVIYFACAESSQEVAKQAVTVFRDRVRGPSEHQHNLASWKLLLAPLLNSFHQAFLPMRQPLTEEEIRDMEKNKRNVPSTDVELFLYNVKKRKSDVLVLLSKFRAADEELRRKKAELRESVNNFQPLIKLCSTKDGFKNQESMLRNVPVPLWLSSEQEMTRSDARRLVAEVNHARKEEWARGEEAGIETVPPSYTLLPTFKLQRAFVTYDWRSIRNMINRSKLSVAIKTPPRRKWWTGIFDFHTRKRIPRPNFSSSGGAPVIPDSRRKKRKLLKLSKSLQTGIHLCARDLWVVTDDDEEYERNLKSPNVRAPYLVNSIKTNGLEVKLLLSTVAPTQKTQLAANRLAPGISELLDRGYDKVQATYDVEKNSVGVFKKAKSLAKSKELKELEVVGLDPGQVQIFTTARAQATIPVSTRRNPREFKYLRFDESDDFPAEQYRFEGLARHSEKKEAERRLGEYGVAVNMYNGVSLKVHGQSEAYVNVVYETLSVMVTELLAGERRSQRFARFRAKQRVMHHMASTAVLGEKAVPEEDVRPMSQRDKEKTGAVKKEIAKRRKERRKEYVKHKGKKRVIFFGAGRSGHGRRGPCPRKALLRSTGLLAPVVLVDEYNTSKCCFGCGTVLEKIGWSREFRCPKSQADENPCPVRHIDRDLNGARNIDVCGTRQLYGLHRPHFLRRNLDDSPEDYFKF